jgi:hypothetical protein
LAGLSIDRVPVGALHPLMNFSTSLLVGLAIQIPKSEPHGKRAKDWRNSSHIVEPSWFWTVWSRFKIHQGPQEGRVRLACALYFGGILARFERNPAEVERLASELIELSTRYDFAFWLPGANVLRGWVRSVCGDTAEGILWIEQGIKDYRATGSTLAIPMWFSIES